MDGWMDGLVNVGSVGVSLPFRLLKNYYQGRAFYFKLAISHNHNDIHFSWENNSKRRGLAISPNRSGY